jgi:hypothetical protein
VKLCVTDVAAAHVVLPACEATMAQVPPVGNVTVVADTVQMPVVDDVYVTGKPELAVAVRVKGVPTVWVVIALKAIVCGCPFTVKVCETGVAAE